MSLLNSIKTFFSNIWNNKNASKKAIKEAEPDTAISASPHQTSDNSIHALFDFLNKDFQQQGYDDALVNADTTYMNQNLEAIQADLRLILRRVNVYYSDAIRQLDFLKESRSRLGLLDVVDELNMKLDKAKSHQIEIKRLEKEIEEGLGAVQRVLISYKKGFINGLSAISYRKMNEITF